MEHLEKIKKLLRLAESDNPNESALALERARMMMKKYGITDHDIKLSDIKEKGAQTCGPKRVSAIDVNLASMIAHLFGCEMYFDYTIKRNQWKTFPVFIGRTPHEEIAAYAYDQVRRKLMKARVTYLKSLSKRMKKYNKTRRADAFCQGYIKAIMAKVYKLVPATKPTELIKAYKAERLPDLRTSESMHRMPNKSDLGALIEGYIEGERERINAGVGRKDVRMIH